VEGFDRDCEPCSWPHRKCSTALALEFTILMAVRTSEAIGAKFDAFNPAAKVWCIHGERMKTGEKHRISLATHVAIVKESTGSRRLRPNCKRQCAVPRRR